MYHAKHQKSLIKPIVISICLFSVVLFLIGYGISASRAYADYESSHAQVIQTKNFEGNPDPNYATKEYWNGIYGEHDEYYIDSITPGETISPKDKPYFINKDITVTSTKNGESALIIGSNSDLTLIFEKCEDGHWPVLTVTGGSGFGSTPSGCGIEVNEGSTLTIKGRGTLNATSGNYVDDAVTRAGEVGGNGRITSGIDKDLYSGTGGAGGSGGGGIAAAIGTKGSVGGQGAPQTKGIYSDDQTAEIDGNKGSDGSNSPKSLNSGNIWITGNMLVNAIAGTLGPSSIIEASAYGAYDEWDGFGWRPCAGGGGAGGSGGFPFLGCAIGTGGAGGAGGGAGGSGGIDFDGAFMDAEIYACNGGGGGAGFGHYPLMGFGGLANPYVCADNVKKAQDGENSSVGAPGNGGAGTDMNNHEKGDDTKGGSGGNGGLSNLTGDPGTVFSSVLESRSKDLPGYWGRNAEIEEFYPNDECTIDCVGGYIDPVTGLHTYTAPEEQENFDDDDPWFKPEFSRTHFPTGTVLGDTIPETDIIIEVIEEVEDKYQKIRASYTQPDDISSVVLTTEYYVVKEIAITVDDSSYVIVSKVYDGTTTLHNAAILPYIKVTYPSEYEGKIEVKPELVDFDTPDVQDETTKNLNLVVKIRSGETLDYPVYLSTATVKATYKITKLYTDIYSVTIPDREYRPDNFNAAITDVKFKDKDGEAITLPEDDFEIKSSTITGDSCGAGVHEVQYTIKLNNATNVSFGTEGSSTQEITLLSSITITKAGISLHSVKATNRAFEKDNYFVVAKNANFINLPDAETFTYGTDYKIYVDSESEHSDQAKITDDNCDAGDHNISCKVKLLNTNYEFVNGTDEVDTTSTVKINKKYIQLASATAEDRQYAFNDFNVEIDDVTFDGLSAEEELVRNTDYTVPVARITDETENVGTHDIAYQVELTSNVKNYTFGSNGASAVGKSTVEISKREIGIDFVEFEPKTYSEGDFSVKIKNIIFSNLSEGAVLTENVDYVVNSCVIAGGSCAPGIHTVKYQIALSNGNYTFSEGQLIDGEAQIEVLSPETSYIAATGDNGLYIIIGFAFVALVSAFALRRATKISS